METTIYKIYELDEVLPTYQYVKGEVISTNKDNNDNNNSNNENEIIDPQIQRDFEDDIDIGENETYEMRRNAIKRYQKIVNDIKEKRGRKCQLCDYSFHMDNGNDYCEAHHIKFLSDDGTQKPDNVILLCPNHHRMFHYAYSNIIISDLINNKRNIEIGKETFIVSFQN